MSDTTDAAAIARRFATADGRIVENVVSAANLESEMRTAPAPMILGEVSA